MRSQSQARWMFAKHPEMAKEWMAETPKLSSLPEHVGKKKKKPKLKKRKRKNQ